MTASTAARLNTEPEHVRANRLSLERSWAARRKWSRSDTARLLNERSEPLLALLRRRPGQWPKHSHALGKWLREQMPAIFDRAHARLAASPTDEARELTLPGDLL